MSHHGNDPEKLAKLAKINAYHVSLFAYLLEQAAGDAGRRRIAARPLDLSCSAAAWAIRTSTITRTCRSSSRAAAPGARVGRHIKYPENTPLANLHLTLLDDMGVHLDSFVDSTGPDRRSRRTAVAVVRSASMSRTAPLTALLLVLSVLPAAAAASDEAHSSRP